MLHFPTVNEFTDSVATPDAFKFAVPRTVFPFRKLTEPAGLADPVDCTVAVRRSASPAVTEFEEAARLVLVGTAFPATVICTAGEMLVSELPSPIYWAVRLFVPAGRNKVESVATPEAFNAPVPSSVAPSMKLTEPVGVAAPPPFTVAMSVSASPAVTGFGDATRVVLVA